MRDAVTAHVSRLKRVFGGSTHGVPTANAPFSIPATKTKPSLAHPDWFDQSFHTNELLAYPLPVLLGIIAQTRMVTVTPAKMKKSPSLVIVGNVRFMYMTMKADTQVKVRYTINTCHRSYAYPSCMRPYMEMTWLARMEVMDAVPKSHPRKFHLLQVSNGFHMSDTV